MLNSTALREDWPSLPLDEWIDTCTTLHLWTQIVGKIRLTQTPWINHTWHGTLYVTSRGLTTTTIPHGTRVFQIDFDFIDHRVVIQSSDGQVASLPLQPQSVAKFYRRLNEELGRLGLRVKIHPKPNEVPDPVRFDEDEIHRAYDPEYATRYWRVLTQADRVFKRFRSGFIGKCSPVHYFWGAPDLAVTRFSGRRAPEHPGGIPNLPDRITRDAYSHEVSSCGFWPGGGSVAYPAFYSYAYPEPAGFANAAVKPDAAFYSSEFREFILPYDYVREANSSDNVLLEFLQTTYENAANLAKWDRDSLEATAESKETENHA
ncbi:MAG: hypothetical protein EHM23_04090 [Acidobacteria bacterium]|nr:MAG: hypothetical protein EHM23_04090 [Acidobacteriota bacterium]